MLAAAWGVASMRASDGVQEAVLELVRKPLASSMLPRPRLERLPAVHPHLAPAGVPQSPVTGD
jgi:hypothetical protein